MKDRIKQLMDDKGMSQQTFANFLEMSPASLSSIFNGRTKPTLNIVEAIKNKIPSINTDWLMFGVGNAYDNNADFSSDELFSQINKSDEQSLFSNDELGYTKEDNAINCKHQRKENNNENNENFVVKIQDKKQRKITEIKVYFDDLTYETFVPSK